MPIQSSFYRSCRASMVLPTKQIKSKGRTFRNTHRSDLHRQLISQCGGVSANLWNVEPMNVRFAPMIGIGGSLAAPPLPHHRTYGSVYGGSRSYANALRSR